MGTLATVTALAVYAANDPANNRLEPVKEFVPELEDFATHEEKKAEAEVSKIDAKVEAKIDPLIEATIAPEIEKLRIDAAHDFEEAGHWLKVDETKLDAYIAKEGASIKKEVLKEEQKVGFWLEGRPLSSVKAQAAIAHNNLLITTKFPSASQCAECHPGQYRQWSVSSHAYAQLSPVYNSMQARINKLTHGTNGDFCVRCHNQVGMTIGEPVFTANANRLPVTREGISCIVCHRVKEAFGRVSGRFALDTGPLTQPMYGPRGPKVLKEVLQNFQVTTDNAAGTLNWKEGGKQVIHDGAVKVRTFETAQLCSNCHDVNGQNGFRLEEAYSQFRNSQAARQGETCQDCHMGKILGEKSGYDQGPIAFIGGVPTPNGKRTNHMFAGPDYSVVHPALFPQNPEAESIASFKEWLEFNEKELWGTDAFEKTVTASTAFPAVWQEERHRRRGREFIDNQLRMLQEYRAQCLRTLRHGYQFGDLAVQRNDARGLAFSVEIRNATNGHGIPTGFDAERLVFLETTVTDRAGKVVFRSGDRDPNGDVRDLHSSYVDEGKVPEDDQLVSFQSKFLLLNLRGGEREQVLPVPISQGPLVFLRPDASSNLLNAGPPATRKQALVIPPNGKRTARYEIDREALTGNGPYTVRLRFICQMIPVNLINEISKEGFDYGLTPRELANRVVEGGFVLWSHTLQLPTKGNVINLRPTQEQVMGPEAVSPGLPWLHYNPPSYDQLYLVEKKAKIEALKAERELYKLKADATGEWKKVEADLDGGSKAK